jgi:hypothetical protein
MTPSQPTSPRLPNRYREQARSYIQIADGRGIGSTFIARLSQVRRCPFVSCLLNVMVPLRLSGNLLSFDRATPS